MEKYLDIVKCENILFGIDKFGIDKIYDDLALGDETLLFCNDYGLIPNVIIQEVGDEHYKLISGQRLLNLNMKFYGYRKQKCLIIKKDVPFSKVFQISLEEHLRTLTKSEEKLILDMQTILFALYFLQRIGTENCEKNCEELLAIGKTYIKIAAIFLETTPLNEIYEDAWLPIDVVKITKILLDFLHNLDIEHQIFMEKVNTYHKIIASKQA